MKTITHLTMNELEAGLTHIRHAPADVGRVAMIVCRPAEGERQTLKTGRLDVDQGLIGDNWQARGSKQTPDGSAHPEMQLNVMNSRVIELIAQAPERWQLAGDQFFVDLDLSQENLPPGTRLGMGTAVIEVTAVPHNGCKKFTERFGIDAVKFVNSPEGKALRMRGLNAKVVESGTVTVGDPIRKLGPE